MVRAPIRRGPRKPIRRASRRERVLPHLQQDGAGTITARQPPRTRCEAWARLVEQLAVSSREYRVRLLSRPSPRIAGRATRPESAAVKTHVRTASVARGQRIAPDVRHGARWSLRDYDNDQPGRTPVSRGQVQARYPLDRAIAAARQHEAGRDGGHDADKGDSRTAIAR